MFEKDIYLMYIPQMAELVDICQQMSQRNYTAWKNETMEAVPKSDKGIMEKILVIIDRCLGQ